MQKKVHKILKKHDKLSLIFPGASRKYLAEAGATFIFGQTKIDQMVAVVEKSFRENFSADAVVVLKGDLQVCAYVCVH